MIKEFLKSSWELQLKIIKWCHKEFQRSAENFMRDFQSLRALLNWLILALFFWESIWLIYYHGDKTGGTVITVTGGLVMAVFTNYVWSSYLEKKHGVARKPPEDSGDDDG